MQNDWRRMADEPDSFPDVDLDRVRQGISQLQAAGGSPNISMPSLDLGPGPLASGDTHSPSPGPGPSTSAGGPSSSFLPPRSPGGARLKAGADKLHPALLQRVLAKQATAHKSAAPGASTPARGRPVFPADVPKNWSGLADLSRTPLSAFGASPIKRGAPNPDDSLAWEGDYAASAADGSPRPAGAGAGGPRPIAKLNLSPVKYRPTPAKEAAARASQYTYDAFEDDIAPPSVLRNATVTYDLSVSDAPLPAPSPSEGLRKGFEEETHEDDEEEDEEQDVHGRVAPPDFGEGATARIADLLEGGEEDEFGGLVVDEEEGVLQADLVDDDEETGDQLPDEGQSYEAEGADISQDVGPTGPEDTLFGMPQKGRARFAQEEQQRDQEERDESFEDDESFAAGQGRHKELRMLGADDMHTLHGGDLLDSEPFEGSPLAGRDRA